MFSIDKQMSREITYRESIREALDEEMERDPRVFLMGEDIALHGGVFKVTEGLFKKFGEKRVKNTPISEAGFTGAAVGAAMTGTRPVIEIMYMDFICCAMDQIINQAAKICYVSGGKIKVPLTIRTQAGAGTSTGAQHSQSLEAWLMHTPGIKIIMPSTPYDAKGLLKSAIRDDNPVMFIEHRMLYGTKGVVPEEEYTIPMGKADIKRQGSDITVVAHSRMTLFALEAAEKLEEEGISVEVIDPRTLVPLDMEAILESVKKTGKAVVVEEGCYINGVGAEISARLMEDAFDYLDAPVVRVAAPDVPVPVSPALEEEYIPKSGKIIQAVRRLIK